MSAWLRDLWELRLPLGLGLAFGAFIGVIAWLMWCGWYFNGH